MEADRKGKWSEVKEYRKVGYFSPQFFKALIKDTVEDELADVAIRLYDFAAYEEINILGEFYKNNINDAELDLVDSFSDNLFQITKDLICLDKDKGSNTEIDLSYSLCQIYALAQSKGIDLPYHIEQKRKYNQTREKMHGGKKY